MQTNREQETKKLQSQMDRRETKMHDEDGEKLLKRVKMKNDLWRRTTDDLYGRNITTNERTTFHVFYYILFFDKSFN